MDEEERPSQLSRRQFVKTAVVAGAVGAAAASGSLGLVALSKGGERPPAFDYVGVKVLPDSKAPRGIPLIPVLVNDGGEVEGRPTHLDWYRYCGRKGAPGLAADFPTDNVFRYAVDPKVLADAKAEGIDVWFEPRVGQKLLAADFKEVGQGAPCVWRSEGHEATNPLTALVVKVDTSGYEPEVAREFAPDGLLGVFATCAHFCCVPTWRSSKQPPYGTGHWDDITCHCHGSWYSVKDLVKYPFPPTG